jgi:hypothetical protein
LLIDPALRTIDRSSHAGLDCARGLGLSLAVTLIYGAALAAPILPELRGSAT